MDDKELVAQAMELWKQSEPIVRGIFVAGVIVGRRMKEKAEKATP